VHLEKEHNTTWAATQTCNICLSSFKKMPKLQRHIKLRHVKSENITKKETEAATTSKENVVYSYKCKYINCSATIVGVSQDRLCTALVTHLGTHIKAFTNASESLVCPICPKEFKDYIKLKRHLHNHKCLCGFDILRKTVDVDTSKTDNKEVNETNYFGELINMYIYNK
jgi:hypothetical protein